MKPHTALIVDDERIARRELRYLLGGHPEIQVVGEAASVDEAVAAIRELHPSLIFLDVQMPRANGFELFERIKVESQVIFVTAYDEFAIRAFEVNALDYLTKPVRAHRLSQTIERYLERTSAGPSPARALNLSDSILLTLDRSPRFIKLAEIECVLAEGDYTRIVCAGGCAGLVLKSMKEWERILPRRYFYRIQRSIIINCEQAVRFNPCITGGYEVYMKHLPSPLSMSRRFARQFRARFEV